MTSTMNHLLTRSASLSLLTWLSFLLAPKCLAVDEVFYETLLSKTSADATEIAEQLSQAYSDRNYQSVAAYLVFFTLNPETLSSTEIDEKILSRWVSGTEDPGKNVIEELLKAKALARDPLTESANTRISSSYPELYSWYRWRLDHADKGYLSKSFQYEANLPAQEKVIFDGLFLDGSPEPKVNSQWLNDQVALFRLANSATKAPPVTSNISSVLHELLFRGGLINKAMTESLSLQLITSAWLESDWTGFSSDYVGELIPTHKFLQAAALTPSALAVALSELDSKLTELDPQMLSAYKNTLYASRDAAYFAYIWPETPDADPNMLSLLYIFGKYTSNSAMDYSPVQFLMYEMSTYLRNIKDQPSRFLTLLLLSKSGINYNSVKSGRTGSYTVETLQAGTGGYSWFTSLTSLNEVFALNYHSGFACEDYIKDGFDLSYKNLNSFGKRQLAGSVPVRYLPATDGSTVASRQFHKRFESCLPLVSFYQFAMPILLSDMAAYKQNSLTNGNSCVSRWKGSQSQSSDACDLYHFAALIGNESQAQAIFGSPDDLNRWFYVLNNQDPQKTVPEQMWSRDSLGIQEQFMCLQWQKYATGKKQSELDTQAFVKSSFDQTLSYLFSTALAYKYLNQSVPNLEQFASYTTEFTDHPEDACGVQVRITPVVSEIEYMPVDFYSSAYNTIVSLSNIKPLGIR